MAGMATFNLYSASSVFSHPSPSSTISSLSLSSKPSVLPMWGLRGKPRFQKIYALSSNDIKVGSNIEVDGAPWRVLALLPVGLLQSFFM
ncbi:uncharacterized protein LOC133872613 isoform X2 [Alnus glutinosa]|uniref:uncharacterized protein LOC133872613 isoform X2 n=1 Tax=Alnus glutinosa TaxID=3517 RepID=UPI002D777100|nr:uncharacterized protein LOC133872613 isoform X2 [Alnus glutinosa]